MIPQQVQAVCFDAVGTLLLPHPGAIEVYTQVARNWDCPLSSIEIRGRFVEAYAQEEELDRANGWRTSEARELRRWRYIVGSVLKEIAEPEICFRELYDHFAQPQAWRCSPGTGEVLQELIRRGYLLAMASNYDHRLIQVVAGMPDLRPLRQLILSAEVGWRKPSLEFFQEVSNKLQKKPNEILYVGDDWKNDYEGACQADMHALLYSPERNSQPGQLQHLLDLLS